MKTDYEIWLEIEDTAKTIATAVKAMRPKFRFVLGKPAVLYDLSKVFPTCRMWLAYRLQLGAYMCGVAYPGDSNSPWDCGIVLPMFTNSDLTRSSSFKHELAHVLLGHDGNSQEGDEEFYCNHPAERERHISFKPSRN